MIPDIPTYGSTVARKKTDSETFALEKPTIYLTNWGEIKERLGLEKVTSESSEEKKLELIRRVTKEEAIPTGYALSYISSHANNWGWDSADLAWEALISVNNITPTHILKFHRKFDLEKIIPHFLEKNFKTIQYRGTKIYYHENMYQTEWIETTELSIQYTALMPEEKVLVLTTAPGSIQMIIDTLKGTHDSLSQNEATSTFLEPLIGSPAAILSIGLGTCGHFTPNPLSSSLGAKSTEELYEEIQKSVEQGETFYLYDAFGLGYEHENGRVMGRFVFHYPKESWGKWI